MKRLNILLPITINKYQDNFYLRVGQPEFVNKISSVFDVKLFCRVRKVDSVDTSVWVKLDDEVQVYDLFEKTSFRHFLQNIKKYKHKIFSNTNPKTDRYLVFYPYQKTSVLLAYVLRNTKLSIWVKSDYIARFTLHEGLTKKVVTHILKPFVWLAYTLVTKFIFRNNLIFYSGDILYNKNNHINQNPIISCSDFNEDQTIISNEITGKVAFVGGESEYKGLKYLLPALDEVDESLSLTIIGMEKMKRFKKYDYLDVNCVGEIRERSEFYKILSEHDVLIMPSQEETQGKVQLEAMSAGVVPICSDSGGTHNTIANFYNGLLFKEGSVSDLVSKLELIYRDKDLYDKLQSNGIDYMKTIDLDKQVHFMRDVMMNYYKHN